MINRRPTLDDVARRAGVSRIAVSRVCSPHPKGYVAAETRQRVLEAIQELGYRPDMRARSLRGKHTQTIGFYSAYGLVPAVEFARSIFTGMEAGCVEADVDMLVFRGMLGQPIPKVLQEITSSKVDGIIYHPRVEEPDMSAALVESRKPVVGIGEPYPGMTTVVSDDEASSRRLAHHLHMKGHRKVLFRKDSAGVKSAALRFKGFTDAAQSLGMTVIATESNFIEERITDEEADILLGFRREGITAVACWRDYSAARVLVFCMDHEIAVPEDLAVVGFDGITPDFTPPELRITTVVIDWPRIAETAVKLLVEKIGGGEREGEVMIPSAFYQGNTA